METTDYQIACRGETLVCSLDESRDHAAPSVLILHGGGPSSRQSTVYLSKVLTAAGKSVVRFDHSGQGDSSGKMNESSLRKRLREARAVLEYFGLSNGITVIGSSMGGHIASRLVQEVEVENLILFCPAAYSRRASEIEFGAGFTEIIRETNSFEDTEIGEILSEFRGRALLIMGTDDDIIPETVVKLYEQALSKCRRFEEHLVGGCPHPIHRWVATRPTARKEIERAVVNFLG